MSGAGGPVDLDKLFADVIANAQKAEERAALEKIKAGQDDIKLEAEHVKDPDSEEEVLKKQEDPKGIAAITSLKIPQKVKLALFGNKVIRAILIRDTNRQIPLFVLQNGRITEAEIIDFARNANLNEHVYRRIAGNSSWTRSYSVKLNLVMNAKVPGDISLKFLSYLHEKDVQRVARSKNVSGLVAGHARKIIEKKEKKAKGPEGH